MTLGYCYTFSHAEELYARFWYMMTKDQLNSGMDFFLNIVYT
ncbi:MAG: hypothetical protein TRG1_3309 [Flavobacteriaceae bacterium FS1-H7996/R]|nr:MAG: hypothetical protein TRG1_3309 [Flavobacteriaceae bacterium FS1-H7996/R]